jgi:hypothetical protein
MHSVASAGSSDYGGVSASYDIDNDSISALNPFLLTESQIQSSQDVPFYFSPEVRAHEVASSTNDRDEDSVESIAATGNSIEDYPYHRLLCIQYPFGTNPKVHCSNCFCVVCEERASDCKDWNAHYSISKEQ